MSLPFTSPLHSPSPLVYAPPVGYHKVTKEDELSDSEEEEVYIKEGVEHAEKKLKIKMVTGKSHRQQATFVMEKVLSRIESPA